MNPILRNKFQDNLTKIRKILDKASLKKIKDKMNYTNSVKAFFKKEIFNLNSSKIKNLISSKLNLKIKLNNKKSEPELKEKKSNFVQTIDFIGIHYSEHSLTIAHIKRTGNKTIIMDNVQIKIKTDLIGDFKVENLEEVKRIIEDVIEVFGLQDPPTILLLGSSYFTAKTFKDSELVVFSKKDPTLLKKSPFLPLNTSIEYQRVSGDKLSSYHIVVYAEKIAIDSWLNVLMLLNNPVVALTCGPINLVDKVSQMSNQIFSYLCDIEDSSTTIYIQKKNCGLTSIKLPYGTSLYKSSDKKIQNQYFYRLRDSINKIMEKNTTFEKENIYITGIGLDNLTNGDIRPIEGFERLSNSSMNYELHKENSSKENFLNKSIFESFSILVDEAIS